MTRFSARFGHAPRCFTTLSLLIVVVAGELDAQEPRWAVSQQIGEAYVKAEYRLDDRSLDALAHLSSTRSDLEQKLGLRIPQAPVEIHLFRSRGSFDRYVRRYVPQGAGRAALFVKNGDGGKVFAYYSSNIYIDMRHESTHAFLHASLPYVPLWLDEGLAEYFEVRPGARRTGHEHLRSLKRSIWFRWKPRIDRLESLQNLSDMREGEYRESWAWVHFMIEGPPEARRVLQDYLADIAAGRFPGAIAPRLRAVFPDLEKQLVSHLKSTK